MATVLRMPEVAAGAEGAVLQEWALAENTPFSATDALAAIETDKAVVDLEAEADGVLLKRLVPAGARAETGAPIAVLGEPGESVGDLAALLAELGVQADGADAPPADAPPPDTAPADTRHPPGSPGGGRVFASPLARRLAAEAGVSFTELTGSGPGGRIVRRDVEAAIAAAPAPSPAAQQAPAARKVAAERPATAERPARAEPAGTGTTRAAAPTARTPAAYTETPHTRFRRAIADRLTESLRTTPHFALRAGVRVDELLKLRAQLNETGTARVSVNDLVIKAAARAHTLVPEMNVVWTPDAVRSFTAVDIGVAVATDRGLVTPVLRAVEERSVTSVAAGTADLLERARAGRLRQDELEGGTLSVTNLGMFGTEEFTAVINPPQAAILAVGAARPEAVVTGDGLSTATVLRVTLSVDHRPVDGVVAARWLAAFVRLMENPVQILA